MSIINASKLFEMDFPPVDFLIDEFLPRNLCLLAGPPKIGKSSLTLSFMQPIITKGMEVYYFSFEDDYRRLNSRLTAMELLDKKLYIHCGREGVLGSTEAEEFNIIQSIAMKSNVSLIVLDTMERILPTTKGKRDYHYFVKVLGEWAKLALQSNTCILMVHHTRKGNGIPEYNPHDAILGSVGIRASFDTNMTMERDKNGKYLLNVEGKDVRNQTLKLDKEGLAFTWEQASNYEHLGATQKMVVRFIEDNQGCTQTDIVSKLGKQKPQISDIVKKLCLEGFIIKDGSELFINNP